MTIVPAHLSWNDVQLQLFLSSIYGSSYEACADTLTFFHFINIVDDTLILAVGM